MNFAYRAHPIGVGQRFRQTDAVVFDAEHHPEIVFKANHVEKTDTGYVATGQLAMRDSVHTVSIPFTFKKDEKTKSAMISGKLDIFAGDYGVGKKSAAGNDRVVIWIEVPASQE